FAPDDKEAPDEKDATIRLLLRSPPDFTALFTKPKAKASYNIEFLQKLQNDFGRLLKEAFDEESVYQRLVFSCAKFVTATLRRKKLFTPHDLLLQLQEALINPAFVEFVRGRFRALFVDEFQDTDPLQWQIFSSLFLQPEWPGYIYLVGDPKQAIYAFR